MIHVIKLRHWGLTWLHLDNLFCYIYVRQYSYASQMNDCCLLGYKSSSFARYPPSYPILISLPHKQPIFHFHLSCDQSFSSIMSSSLTKFTSTIDIPVESLVALSDFKRLERLTETGEADNQITGSCHEVSQALRGNGAEGLAKMFVLKYTPLYQSRRGWSKYVLARPDASYLPAVPHRIYLASSS